MQHISRPQPPVRVLIIAGSDSGGGAGIQADIKTVTMLGGFAMTAITAITAQNTVGVSAIMPVSTDIVDQQINACLDDIGADIIKTGMLGSVDLIETLAARFDRSAPELPKVIDPVMIATSGAKLIADSAIEALKSELVANATLVTPNAPEAALLTGLSVDSEAAQMRAGEALLKQGAQAALIKGGHIDGDELVDVLVTQDATHTYRSPRIDTRATHGTGCTLASAIATCLASGKALPDAVSEAHAYLQNAIRSAYGLGSGHGPVSHNWALFDQKD